MHAVFTMISIFAVLQVSLALQCRARSGLPAALHPPSVVGSVGVQDSTETLPFDSLWTFKAGG
ncbi:MAG: hypothetical protein JSV33_10905 [bacterium]|nr:MAG: hypothetical protein JSV33_10905 [bacterium]